VFSPGQKYRPSASRENEIDRMLRDYRAGSGSFVRPAGEPMPMGHMLGKNNLDYDLQYGSVVMYHANLGYRSTQGQAANRRDYDMRKDFLELRDCDHLLSDSANPFGGLGIVLETIAPNQLGRVAIAGLALLNQVPFFPRDKSFRYLQPHPFYKVEYSYWGFGRALAFRSGIALIDLSDRHFDVAYQLTSDMTNGSATATLGINSTYTWETTVHDLHGVAGFQKNNNKGICEWRGERWIVKVAYC
jgi:hypothetical protein